MSQGNLARKVGIDPTYLSKLENDRQPASNRVLRSLALALDVEVESLMAKAQSSGLARRSPAGTARLSVPSGSFAPPRYPTRFVDRHEEVHQLQQRLSVPGALVVVTGPPGCGKTRLLAYALERSGRAAPVAWVTVGAGGAGTALPQLPVDGLLVLDDADRDRERCIEIAQAAVAEGVTVAVTSRQRLGVYGERELRLDTLPVPDRHQRPAHGDVPLADLARLREQASVQLFLDRAALHTPDFTLDRSNAPAVFDVCRWLDGLPLAIELAALRLRQMTVADLAANVPDLLDWLSDNTLGVPDRHGSLVEAIAWSFDRLDERQQDVATRLSVFETTFTLDDAVSVARDEGHEPAFVEATVLAMVDRSLLMWRESADRRALYRWLRPLRQYARVRLEATPTLAQARARYRSWLIAEAASLDESMPRREGEWERLAELTPELVSAVYDLPAEERAAVTSRMADALTKSLQFGNRIRHVAWFSERLGGRGSDVLREAGMVARIQGDFAEAHRSFFEAYRLAEGDSRNPTGQANAALDLAENASDRGALDEAERYATIAWKRYDELGDDRGRIEVLNLRGKLRQERDEPDAHAAEPLFAEAFELAARVDDRRLIAYSLHNLGVCDYLRRRVASARRRLDESLNLRLSMRNHRGVARVIEALALVESEVHNHELVLRLLGSAQQYRASSGVLGIAPWWQARLEAAEQDARFSIGSPEAADRLLHLGKALRLREAGELAAIADAPPLHEGPLGDPVATPLRAVPPPYMELGERADAVASRGEVDTVLDAAVRELVESRDGASDAFRHLNRSMLLALAEPAEGRAPDLLCVTIDPGRYRGVIVPVFTGGLALREGLERFESVGSHQVVEVRLDQLRAGLVPGETVVVNPWTRRELRLPQAEPMYAPIEIAPADDLAASS